MWRTPEEIVMKPARSWLFVIAMAWLGSACAAGQQAQGNGYEEKSSWTNSFLSQILGGEDMPNGVNRWDCVPAPGRSHVVLVHGTFSSTMYSYGALAPRLANQGYCVYAQDFGSHEPGVLFKATRGVDTSAREVSDFIDEVLQKTGAQKVDLIGHSQGGLLGFYYLKKLGGSKKVNHFVALAPSLRGTQIAKTPNRNDVSYCLACADQHPQSDLIKDLHKTPVAMNGVKYSIVVTNNDLVVVPVDSQFLREPGVQNVLLQDYYPDNRSSHSGMLYNEESLNLILKTLEGKTETLAKTVQ
jgi:triacylglycerol esterase/lipase EstA (alpha/beta hydrolase family)